MAIKSSSHQITYKKEVSDVPLKLFLVTVHLIRVEVKGTGVDA